MKLAIMQPYFLPYIGYFQLLASVDRFIVYDNIKYTKKGWINRNRMLLNGKHATFTVPVRSDHDHLDICDRRLAADFSRQKLLAQFKGAYGRAPCFAQAFPVIADIVNYGGDNLFDYIHHSLVRICDYLEIRTEIVISSTVPIDHSLKAEEKVLALCEANSADTYINAIGGTELYSRQVFLERNIDLMFLKSRMLEYAQAGGSFVPWLSIIDLMMFNDREHLQEHLAACDFV